MGTPPPLALPEDHPLCGDSTPCWTWSSEARGSSPTPNEVGISAPGAYSHKSLWFLSTEEALEIISKVIIN